MSRTIKHIGPAEIIHVWTPDLWFGPRYALEQRRKSRVRAQLVKPRVYIKIFKFDAPVVCSLPQPEKGPVLNAEAYLEHHKVKTAVELVQRIVTTHEGERRRISRDLHDQLGQRLTALRLKLASLGETACSPEEEDSLKPTFTGSHREHWTTRPSMPRRARSC